MFSPSLGSAGDGEAAPRDAWLTLGELSSFSSAFHTPLERPWHRDELYRFQGHSGGHHGHPGDGDRATQHQQ